MEKMFITDYFNLLYFINSNDKFLCVETLSISLEDLIDDGVNLDMKKATSSNIE